MSPADLQSFWHRTTETLQQTPVRATCTDAAAERGLRDLALKCCLETRDIDQAREITETMSSENGESPNILLKKASVLGLLVRYEEARDILLRLNQDFPGRPADLRRLVIVFKQLRDVRKVAAFLKAYARAVAHDAGASEQRERFAALGFR